MPVKRGAAGAAASALAGLFVSVYLLFPEQVTSSPYCTINRFLSCGPVITGEYSKFLGVPVAAYGVMWFAAASTLSLLSMRGPHFLRYLTWWGAVGMAGVAYLVSLEFFVIGSVCVFCTLAHLLGALVLGFAVLARSESG